MWRERAAALVFAVIFEVACTVVICVLLAAIGACLWALFTGAA
jgi:hypothetical protein